MCVSVCSEIFTVMNVPNENGEVKQIGLILVTVYIGAVTATCR